ncbi:MAG: GAF domain-containing protein [Thermoplasmatales archaeon]
MQLKKYDYDRLLYEYREKFDNKNPLQYTVNFLRNKVDKYNWVGIYMVEDDDLVLRAWDGPEATEHVRIKIGEGICGLAAKEQFTVVVPDVSKDSRYIACFPNTKSEIVVPIFNNGKVIGEIDIDSDLIDPFDKQDEHFLESIANFLGSLL